MATLQSPTLQRLIHNVRGLLNQPDRNNSFWSDEDLTTYINDAVAIYFMEVKHNNEGLFTVQSDLDIVENTDTIALPSDCFQVRGLWKKTSQTYEPMPYRNRVDEAYPSISVGTNDMLVPYYYLRGNSIVLRPIPAFNDPAGIRIEYLQFPDTLVNGGDVLTAQVSPIFKQLIEMYAVYKAKLKESLVTGSQVHRNAEENLEQVYTLFKQAVQLRSIGSTFVKAFNPEEA